MHFSLAFGAGNLLNMGPSAQHERPSGPPGRGKPNEKVHTKMAKKEIKTKAQIVEALAEESGVSKKQAKAALEALVAIAYEGAKQKDGFTVPGLGKLILKQQKARTGRNPATGAEIKIPAKKVLKFRIAKAAKDAILPKKAK